MVNFLFILLISLLYTFNSSFADLRVIDADTIKLNGDKVRLSGIDAPETSQTCLDHNKKKYKCGKQATQKLIQLIQNSSKKSVNCKYNGSDKYGRFIGNCWVDDILINSWLVENGWALAYRRYSKEFIEEGKLVG